MMEVSPSLVASSVPALLLGIYVAGTLVALFVIDAPPLPRLGLALLWPVGPIAFVVTLSCLLLAVPIAFPLVGTGAFVGVILVAALAYRAC